MCNITMHIYITVRLLPAMLPECGSVIDDVVVVADAQRVTSIHHRCASRALRRWRMITPVSRQSAETRLLRQCDCMYIKSKHAEVPLSCQHQSRTFRVK